MNEGAHITERARSSVLASAADDILQQLEHEFESIRPPIAPSVVTPDFWTTRNPTPDGRDPAERSWEHILPPPASEWAAERRHQQVLVKKLPRAIRKLIRRISNTHQREQVIDFVLCGLRRRAARQRRIFETTAPDEVRTVLHPARIYVPGIDLEELARGMATDGQFMLRLFKHVKSVKRHARQVNAWIGGQLPEDLPRVHLPSAGKARVADWLGLVIAPLPYHPPEGLLLGLAQGFWRRARIQVHRALRVLDWGAGNSPFTRALVAVNPSVLPREPQHDETDAATPSPTAAKHDDSRLIVDEVDVLGDAPEFTFVNRTSAIPGGRAYDFILVQLPPPCSTRGGHRDRHKGLHSGKRGQVRLRDLGRLGIRRWSTSAPRVVRNILEDAPGSENVAVLVPLFEVGAAPDQSHQEQVMAAVQSIQEALRGAGLRITHDFETGSAESAEQWQCVVASRGALSSDINFGPDLDDYDSVEAFLQAIDP